MVNWKVAAGLGALLVALAVYLFVARPPATSRPANVVLLDCPPGEVVDFRVSGEGKATELKRDAPGAAWKVVAPVAGPADAGTVDSLDTAAYDLTPTSALTSPPPASAMALDPPSLTVVCSLPSGRSYTLTVGGQTFDGTGYYARSGGRLYVIPAAPVGTFRVVLDTPPVAPSPSPSGSPSPSPSA